MTVMQKCSMDWRPFPSDLYFTQIKILKISKISKDLLVSWKSAMSVAVGSLWGVFGFSMALRS